MNKIQRNLGENPIIAAVRNKNELKDALLSPVLIVFLLHADIFDIGHMVDEVKAHNKSVFMHLDFLEGLARDHKAVEYISKVIKPDGIISTRGAHLKYAAKLGLFTIQRFFMIDSQSYDTAINTLRVFSPDMIEIMPALMPSVIHKFTKTTDIPIIAGGLIQTKKDIIDIISAGAQGASTGKKELWLL